MFGHVFKSKKLKLDPGQGICVDTPWARPCQGPDIDYFRFYKENMGSALANFWPCLTLKQPDFGSEW